MQKIEEENKPLDGAECVSFRLELLEHLASTCVTEEAEKLAGFDSSCTARTFIDASRICLLLANFLMNTKHFFSISGCPRVVGG